MATLTAPYVHPFGASVVVDGDHVVVRREDALASDQMDRLARDAVFGDGLARQMARWLIWELAQEVGVRPASIHSLYMARGRGLVHGFTVPAINVRGMAYDTARSVFRAVRRLDVGAFICEIARSEIGYTDQRPAEYASVILAAALREGFRGPVFIQGDHFQVNAKKYATDPRPEVDAVIQLAREAVAAGFFNIDVDTSTLVDLHRQSLADQQRLNVDVGGEIAAAVRSVQPKGVTISIGGEIGEVGTKNSTVEELRAYMDGFNAALATRTPAGTPGLSKISVQSGTSHGGVVLADGSIADVKLDFHTLEDLSVVARKEYGLAGAVQHGASTLPDAAFHHFPRTETAEIHLATNFQNMLYDGIPTELRDRDLRVAPGECEGRAQADRYGRAIHLQDPQKGASAHSSGRSGISRLTSNRNWLRRTTRNSSSCSSSSPSAERRAMVAQYVQPVPFHRPAPGAPGTGEHAAAPDDLDLSD